MAKQPTMPETLEEMAFPIHGVNLIKEFEQQPDGTTPTGVNVRAYESLTQRNRGGSRAGLVPYIDSTVLSMPSLIQHLNVIVDPTTDALLIDDPDDPTAIDDPSTNNLSLRNPPPARKVRRGGTAQQPNRNKKTKKKKTVKLIQQVEAGVNVSGGGASFPMNVTKGNIIVIFATSVTTAGLDESNPFPNTGTSTALDNVAPFISFGDNLGSPYAQAGSLSSFSGPYTLTLLGVDCIYDNAGSAGIFYAVVQTTGPCSLGLFTSGGSAGVNAYFQAAEFGDPLGNTFGPIPLDGAVQNGATVMGTLPTLLPPSGIGNTGAIPVTGSIGGGGDLLVASLDVNASFDPVAGWTFVGGNIQDGLGYRTNSGSADYSAGIDNTTGPFFYRQIVPEGSDGDMPPNPIVPLWAYMAAGASFIPLPQTP